MKKQRKIYNNFHQKSYNYRQQKADNQEMEADKMLRLMYLGYYDDDEKEGVVFDFDLN